MKQVTVLIIEDDPWFAEQQERVLAGAGFHVERAANGLAGMQLLDKTRPDALLLDVFLPGPNAFVLLHEMQSYTDLSKLPVILCTSIAPDIALSKVQPYGVRSVLDKETMRPSDLIAAIRRELV